MSHRQLLTLQSGQPPYPQRLPAASCGRGCSFFFFVFQCSFLSEYQKGLNACPCFGGVLAPDISIIYLVHPLHTVYLVFTLFELNPPFGWGRLLGIGMASFCDGQRVMMYDYLWVWRCSCVRCTGVFLNRTGARWRSRSSGRGLSRRLQKIFTC